MKIFDKIEDTGLFENSVECLLNTFCSPNALVYTNTIKELVPKVKLMFLLKKKRFSVVPCQKFTVNV